MVVNICSGLCQDKSFMVIRINPASILDNCYEGVSGYSHNVGEVQTNVFGKYHKLIHGEANRLVMALTKDRQ